MTSTTRTEPARKPEPAEPATPLTTRLGGLDIAYDARVLRPRPWTVAQARWAADLLRVAPPGPVLELCTGAGQIGLLAIVDNDRRLVAVDADPVACGYARSNAEEAGLGDRVEVRNRSLHDAVGADELFPVIIADPPWVPTEATGEHPEDPPFAIDGGADGLDIARACVSLAHDHLAPDGVLLLQLGTPDQARALEDLLPVEGPEFAVSEVRQPAATGVVVCLRRTP